MDIPYFADGGLGDTGLRFDSLCIRCVGDGTYLPQMHGLCHTYKLSKAHYFCWSMSQGFLLAEITFEKELWNELLYPLYKEFADWWAVRHIPKERISAEYKTGLADDIRALCNITACKEVQMLAPHPTQ